MAGNIFQIAKINFEQTINVNRFSLRFDLLADKLAGAKDSFLPGVKDKWERVQGALGNTGNSVVDSLEIALVSCSFPSIKIETANIPRFNDFVKTTTKFTATEDMTVEFMDYVNGSASAIMLLWQAFVGDKKTGAMGFKGDFVLPSAYFYVYGPDAPAYDENMPEGADGPYDSSSKIPFLQEYKIVNIFPKEVNFPQHTQDSADARKVSVVFAIDNIYPTQIYGYKYNAETAADRYTKKFSAVGSGQGSAAIG